MTWTLHVDVPVDVERAALRFEVEGFEPLEVTLRGDAAREGVYFAVMRRFPSDTESPAASGPR